MLMLGKNMQMNNTAGENTKASGIPPKNKICTAVSLAVAALASLPYNAISGPELPTGANVVHGRADVSSTGNTLTVDQLTNRAVINWQSFSVGESATVTFDQPGSSSITLNQVVGQDPTAILGNLIANGSIFISNPAGVLFGNGARVDAQGIVATTRVADVEAFMEGTVRFSGNSTAKIENLGTIFAAEGGYVFLIGATIKNNGSILAEQGDIVMAAGDEITISLDKGGLTDFSVDKGTIESLVENGGLIQADGGRIWLTAQGLNHVSSAVINQSGIIQAQTVGKNKKGQIVLLADLDTGKTNVSGEINASAPNGGDGGFIETSAAKVTVEETASLTTQAKNGATGEWLIDPYDFTVAESGGDISGETLTSQLENNNVTLQTYQGSQPGTGDLNVKDDVSWDENTLILLADRNIYIDSTLDAGNSGRLELVYNQGGNGGFYFINGQVLLGGSSGFSTTDGWAGELTNWTIITELGSGSSAPSDPHLVNINNDLTGNYVLGRDLNGYGNDFGPSDTALEIS